MAAKHEVEATFKLKDEMSVQLEAIRKRAAALEKDAKALTGQTEKVQGSFAELTKGLDRFAPGLSRTVTGVTDLTKGLSPLAVGLGLIGATATAVGGAILVAGRELVAMGSELGKLERETGISAESLQRLQFAAGQLEIPFEQLTSSSVKLEAAIGEGGPKVSKAIKDIGLSLDQLRVMRGDERLLAVSRALSNIENPAKQAAAGAALFGKSWSELRLRPEDIDELTAALGRAPAASDEALAAGRALGDQWDELTANVKVLAVEGVAPLVGALATYVESLNLTQRQVRKFVDESEIDFKRLARAFETGGTAGVAFEVGRGSGKSPADLAAAAEAKHRESISATNDALEKSIIAKQQLADISRERAEEESAKAAAKAQEEWNRQLEKAIPLSREFYKFQLQAIQVSAEIPNAGGSRFGEITGGTPGALPGLGITPRDIPKINDDLSDIVTSTELMEAAQREYNQALSVAADLSQIIGGNVGNIIGQSLAAASALKNLGNVGGIGGAFKVGKGDSSSGFFGLLGGIGGVTAAIGPLIAPVLSGIQALFSIGGPDIARDAGRDMGAALSEGLEQEIEKSGKNVQLFLTEIFAEGGISVDRFAEEVGDLFSMFERGELSKETVISELMEDLPVLIEHFNELGPVGVENLQRIIDAAQQMGFDLGAAGDQLERLQKGIPELTLEGFVSKFDLDEAQQAKLQSLGLGIQTDEERVADQLNVPLELLKELAPALEEIGISLTELPDFMESLGIEDLGDLATTLQLPPELIAQFEALKPPDPKTVADANGAAVANHLGPALDALGDKIIRGIRDAVAQNS